MHSGRQLGDILNREGNYHQAFPEDFTDTAVRLNGYWDDEEMAGWATEMPSAALDILHNDLRAAQRERARTHKERPAATAEQPTAS
jgi:hypothetical protein